MIAAIRVLAVIALLAGFLWWLRTYDRRSSQPVRRRAARTVEVIGQARLSRQATVTVVRIGSRSLTLGVTDHGVNLLSECEYVEPVAAEDPEEPPVPASMAAARTAFASVLQTATAAAKARSRTEGTVRSAVKKTPARKPEQLMTQ